MVDEVSQTILEQEVEKNRSKFLDLFKLTSGRINREKRESEKSTKSGKQERRFFYEVKAFNDKNQLAGIAWYFGRNRAYIEDVRTMIGRKEDQKVPMVLITNDSTTSAGKKELKKAGIELLKTLTGIRKTKVRRVKKKQVIQEEEIADLNIEDDVDLKTINKSDLLKRTYLIVQSLVPEIIKTVKVPDEGVEILDLKGYSSNNHLITHYRTIDKVSIGILEVRALIKQMEDPEKQIPYGIVGRDKFTPAAKKEAQEKNITLVSLKLEKESEGNEFRQQMNERLLMGIKEIITHQGYEIAKASDKRFASLLAGSEKLGIYTVAEVNSNSNLMALIPSEDVVRVATIRLFKKQMENLNIKTGMVVARSRFTYTADRECKKYKIIAFRKNHPVFNVFTHFLVPVHTIVKKEEKRELFKKYNCKIHHLPKIFNDDLSNIQINAQVGDVIKVERQKQIFAYRLVIRRPESEVEEDEVS